LEPSIEEELLKLRIISGFDILDLQKNWLGPFYLFRKKFPLFGQSARVNVT